MGSSNTVIFLETNVENEISTLEYNNRTVYDCFNNTFTYEFGSSALHLPLIIIYDWPNPHKISQYTPDLLPAAIYVSSINSVSNLPPHLIRHISFLLMILILSMLWITMCIYLVDYTKVTEIGIIVKKDAMKIQGSIAPHPLIITRSFIIVMGFQGLV